jgi:hypothetical protein
MNAPQHGQMVLSSQYSAQGMYPQQLNYGMAPHNMAPQPNTSLLMSQPQHAALSTSELVQLLVDERQFKVELKSKIDTVSTKLEQLSDKIDAPQRGRDVGGFTPRNLLDLIQKMVLENERLTVDAEEKGRHVTLLRENINQLHERNQRVVDENSKFSQERVQLAQLDQVREERNRLTQELQLSVQEKNKLQREFLQLQSVSPQCCAPIRPLYRALQCGRCVCVLTRWCRRRSRSKRTWRVRMRPSKLLRARCRV